MKQISGDDRLWAVLIVFSYADLFEATDDVSFDQVPALRFLFESMQLLSDWRLAHRVSFPRAQLF